jgi:hypothetical protein
MTVIDHDSSFPIFWKDCKCRKWHPPIDELHGPSRGGRFVWYVVLGAYVTQLIFPIFWKDYK